MMRFGHITKRTFFSLRAKPIRFPPTDPAFAVPSQTLVDEETWTGYTPETYYPAKPGEVLAGQFQLMTKIGWGTGSTVWLAQDISRFRWQSERSVVLKILNTRSSDGARELQATEDLIARKNPSHLGHVSVRTCLGSFEITNQERKHLCQIYEPMRETMAMFQQRWPNRRMPLPVAKAYILLLLLGIDYLHAECKLIHTDLKLANILMTFENELVLPQFLKDYVIGHQIPYKTNSETNHTVYACFNSLGELEQKDIAQILPKITDFGAAWKLEDVDPSSKSQKEAVYIIPVQPNYYRSPEVVLGYGWNFSADIWNFGVLLWNIIEGTELFTQVESTQGVYDPKSHLAEMIALLGPPPKEVLKRAEYMSKLEFDSPIISTNGKASKNPREFFGGPYFDPEGNFLHEELIPKRKLEDTVSSLAKEEKELFLSFAKEMLMWVPSERKTASELVKHPFLNFGGHVVKDLV